jgi:hypothetical protein
MELTPEAKMDEQLTVLGISHNEVLLVEEQPT